MQNKLYDNFQEIVQTTGDSPQVILKDLFSDVRNQFNINNLVEQRNTKFSPETKSLEDYDVYMLLHAMIALKKSDFDYYLRESLVETDANYAPLYSQEYAAYLATAMAVNPDIMNAAVNSIDTPKGTYGSELIRYWNTVMVDGIGGAGKTAVIAKLIQNIVKKYYPDAEIWKVGPTKQQVDNLVSSLGSEGRAFTIEDLMSHVLGESNYAELSNDILHNNKESKKFTIEELGPITSPGGTVMESYRAAIINEDIEYNDVQTPRLVFIDEATWVNSLYMQHLSNWAHKNNVTIVPLGDLNQNGYENPTISVYNVKSSESLMVRTPKLDISLRITNTQQNDNNTTVNAALSVLTFTPEQMADSESQANAVNSVKDTISNMMELHYYQDEDNILNGSKFVTAITEDDVRQILERDGEVGYVYDDENTPTYKMLTNMADSRIIMRTPKSVQGSEFKHAIIDVNFSKYNTNTVSGLIDYMKSFYTMMSRSKDGAYFINSNMGTIIKEANLRQDEHTSTTSDPSAVIDRFKVIRMAAFDAELEGYTPSRKAQEPPMPEPAPVNPEEAPEPVKSTDIPEPTPTTEEKPKEVQAPTFIPPSRTMTGTNELENEFLADIEGKGEESVIDESLLSEPLSGIRAYGWYMRYGMAETSDGKFTRVVRNDVVDDLNVFTRSNVEYDTNTLQPAKDMLVDVRNYLAFGEKFDADFIQKLSDNGYKYLAGLGTEVWNNGTFNLEIRKDDTNEEGTDKARDKQGYDSTKVEPVAFNIVYRIPMEKGNDLQFTIGKLTNPDTWQKWNNSNGKDADIAARLNKYKKWYKNMQKEILDNPSTVKYLGIDESDISFSAATRLKKVPDQTWNLDKVREAFPNAIISPMYLYAGHGGVAMVDKSVRGKGVVFATSNKHLKIDGEKVTESNLAEMYLRMQKKRKAALDEAKSRGLSDKEAQAEVAKMVPPLIRMIVANSNGTFIDNYFRLSFNDLVHTADDGKTKLDKNQVKEYLGTFGSNTTAARMLVSMWNYRSGLKNFIKAYDTYRQANNLDDVRGTSEVNEFNRLIDQSTVDGQKRVPWDSSIYNGFMFRLTYADAIKTNAPGMVVRPINLSRNEWQTFDSNGKVPRTLTYGVYIDPKVAQAQLSILDNLFSILEEYISLPGNPNFTIATNGRDMDNILAQLIADDGAIELTDGKNTYKHAASNIGGMGGSFKMVGLLSSVYKLFSAGKKSDESYVFRAKARDGKMKETRLEELSFNIVRAVRDAGRDNYFSVLNNMFNVIFHGTPTIKEGAATTTYAPFINGIYYTPRTPTSHDSRPSDFYPTRNNDNQFYIDTAIESPNFEITIDPTVLSERQFNKGIPHNRQSEFDNNITLIANGVSSAFTGYTSIDQILNDARNEYLEKGDIALNEILKGVATKINTSLTNDINNRQLLINNDPVIHLDMTVDVNNMPVINKVHTLLQEINVKSPSVLPKTKDGEIDTTGIQNVDYSSGNLQDFTVYLQGGQTIKGSIIGSEVNIVDTVMYEVPFDPNREQKLKIFEDTIGDHENLRETEIMTVIQELRATTSLTPEAADALLDKIRLVDNHFEGYLTDEQLDDPDILDVMEYINSLANNKQIIDSQNCKLNI